MTANISIEPSKFLTRKPLRSVEERNELAKANVGLVFHAVQMWTKNQFDPTDEDELIGLAQFGLLRAAEGFDESKGFKFSTLAMRCIFNSLHSSRKPKQHLFDEQILRGVSANALHEFHTMDSFEHHETEEPEFDELDQEDCYQILSMLDGRDFEIVSMRLGFVTGEPMTLLEIGRHFRISRERVRQLYDRAIGQLRERLVA